MKKEIPKALDMKSQFSVIELKDALEILQVEVGELMEKLKKLDDELTQAKIVVEVQNNLNKTLSEWSERYKRANFIDQKTLLNQVIDKIILYEDKNVIAYKDQVMTYKDNCKDI